MFTGLNNVGGGGGVTPIAQIVNVAKSGGDFTTIESAIASISDSSGNKKYTVKVYNGVFAENPLVLKEGITLELSSGTVVAPVNANSALLTINTSFSNFRGNGGILVAPSNSSAILATTSNARPIVKTLTISGTGTGIQSINDARITIESCFMLETLTIGLHAQGTGRIDGSNILSLSQTAFFADGGTMWLHNCGVENAVNAMFVDNTGFMKVFTMSVENCTNGLRTGTTGQNVLEGSNISILGSVTQDVFQENADSIIDVSGGILEATKFSVTNWNNIFLDFGAVEINEAAKTVLGELQIGNIEKPSESSFGEGDSTTLGMLLYTKDNLNNFTNVTSIVKTFDANTITLPGIGVGNAFYISCERFQDNDYYKFSGIKTNVTTNVQLGNGELKFQYWNGSSWITFNVMSTNAEKPYDSYANNFFNNLLNPDSEHIYFNLDILDSWEKNDEPGVGVDMYWIRVYVVSDISVAPSINYLKIHTNHKEVNGTGWVQFQGRSRPVRNLDWAYNGVQAFGGATPNNSDIYLSDNLGFGRSENRFANNAVDIVGFSTFLPSDIDTSTSVKLRIFAITNNPIDGTVNLTVRYGYANSEFNDIFITAGSAPTVSENEQFIFSQLQLVGINKLNVFEFSLNLSDVIPRKPDGSAPDILCLSIERDGSADSFSGNFIIVDILATYRAWNNGGFPIEFTKTVDFFENWESNSFATNSWSVVNSAGSLNQWVIGTVNPYAGTYSSYISANGGTNEAYSGLISGVDHIYTDITIPSTAKRAFLAFAFKGIGEVDFDYMNVYAVPTSITPTADNELNVQYRLGKPQYNNTSNFDVTSITIPPAFIGQTMRLVFSFRYDGSIAGATGANVDNIEVWHLE